MQGHIQRRGKSWRLTIDVGRDPVSGQRRRVTRTTRTRAEAQALARELAGVGNPGTGARTVGELLDLWYDRSQADWSASTRPGYRSKIDLYLKPEFGELPLRKLTAAKIDDLYRRIRTQGHKGKPLSVATVRRTHAVLSGACSQAVKWGWLPTNPCDNATPGRLVRAEINPPTIAEIRQILAAATAPLEDFVQLALATGARRGELCGLQWVDCNLDLFEGSVTIRRSVADTKGGTIVVDQRRKSRTRTVSIDPVTVAMLKARRIRARADAIACNVVFTDSGYVLAEKGGQLEPLRPQIITGRWRDAAERVGSKARFHDLRHFHVTELLAAGVPVRQVASRVGHTSGAAMTLNVYAHAVERLDRRAAEVIAEAIDG